MQTYRMIYSYHEIFGTWFVENLKALVPHERGFYFLKTNNEGIRSSKEYRQEQSSDVCRMLVFGDSYTAGDGVNNEERFTDILENSLENVEVINFGLPGSGVDQQLLIFENLGKKFGGNILLLCPSVEDINRSSGEFWPFINRTTGETLLVPKPYFILENGGLKVHNVPVPRKRIRLSDASEEVLSRTSSSQYPQGLLSLYKSFREKVLPIEDQLFHLLSIYKLFPPYPQYDTTSHPDWLLMKALLKRFIASAGLHKIILAPLPTYHYIEGFIKPNYVERFVSFVEENPQIHFINLLPYFTKLSPQERRQCRYSKDVHFTHFGHSIIADALKTELAPFLCLKS